MRDDRLGVGEIIIIEADSPDAAYLSFEIIGSKVDGFYDYCQCCGERWQESCSENGTIEPMIYGVPLSEVKSNAFAEKCFTHYKDGRIKEIYFTQA